MNSNQIYVGDEYAWYPNKPKGYTPLGAAKVKVLSSRRRKNTWQKNASTEVEIEILEVGNEYAYYKVGQTRHVPAREIIDFWDDYQDEIEMKKEEARLRAIRAEKERKERELQRHREQTKKLVLQNEIGSKLVEKGLPYGSITLYGDNITIPLATFLHWLGITDEAIDLAVDVVLASEPANSQDGDPSSVPSGNL